MSRAISRIQSPPQISRLSSELHTPKFDLMQLVKRKLGFILFFVAIGVMLSLLYFIKTPQTFRSTAKIYVDEKNAPSINTENDSILVQTTVEKYLEVIKSSRILVPAIEKGEFSKLQTFSETKDILFELREKNSLSSGPADRKSNSGVIKLAFEGKDATECRFVLDHIVDSFDAYIKSTTKDIGGETATIVGNVQKEYLNRLNEVEKEIQELVVKPQVLTVDGTAVDPKQLQQAKIYEDLHELKREKTKLISRLENVKKSRIAGKDPDTLLADILQEFTDSSLGAYVPTHNRYMELKVHEQELINQFGSEHPELISIRKQIEMVDKMRIQELSSMRTGNAEIGPDGKPRQLLDIFLEKIESKIDMLNTEEISMEASIVEVQKDSVGVTADLEKLRALRRERERLETGYNAIIERLSEINAVKEHLWRNMTVLDPPAIGELVGPSLIKDIAGGIFLGGLFGFAFAGLKEMAEKTFYSSEEIGSIIDARVIGHVNQFQKSRGSKNPKFPNVASEVVAIHKPAALESESYRAIRTSIFFKAQEIGAKVIQITSPSPGDGKSTTISNLAASIAQSGRKVLVIDADFRRPMQHKLFGISNDFGLTSVICGEMDPDEATQVIQQDFLSVIACGPIPANPAELLTSSRFPAIIEEFRDSYDYILVDSPPLLAVTDPSIVCTSVDLVYLVFRIRNGIRSNSIESKAIIDSLGVELGGIIINGLRRRDQKKYHYSGQYGYRGYQYGHSKAVTRTNPRHGQIMTPKESETGA